MYGLFGRVSALLDKVVLPLLRPRGLPLGLPLLLAVLPGVGNASMFRSGSWISPLFSSWGSPSCASSSLAELPF